jgi:hypothetical protein
VEPEGLLPYTQKPVTLITPARDNVIYARDKVECPGIAYTSESCSFLSILLVNSDISGRYFCLSFCVTYMLCNASVYFCSFVIRVLGFVGQTSECRHIATWNFLVSSSIVDISEKIRSKTRTVYIARWEGGEFLLKWSNKQLNQCLSVRPKFTCPVMKNSLFSKISRSRCLPNLLTRRPRHSVSKCILSWNTRRGTGSETERNISSSESTVLN